MTSSPSQILELCAHLNTLKHLRRTGWVKCAVVEPETVASHMYRMAMLAMTLPDTATYTSSYLTEMCLVHDVAECIVGDITPHCGVSNEDKHTKEKNALNKICTLLPSSKSDHWRKLWFEYEEHTTEASIMAHDLDKFDMIVQAFEYEMHGHGIGKLQQFFDSTENVFRTELVKSWVVELKAKRELTIAKGN